MGTLSATFGNGSFLLWMLEFFLFVIWFYLLIMIFGDLFRDPDTSGVKKVLWTIFVIVIPYVGIFVYLIARGKGMAARSPSRCRRHRTRSMRGSAPRQAPQPQAPIRSAKPRPFSMPAPSTRPSSTTSRPRRSPEHSAAPHRESDRRRKATHVSTDVQSGSTTDLDETGPIDYLVVEFPGNKMTGEGFPAAGRPRRLRHHPHPRSRLRHPRDRRLDHGHRHLRHRRRRTARPGHLPGRLLRSARIGRHRRGHLDPRAGELGRHPRLRERVGRTLRRRPATRRRPARGQRPHPRAGHPRVPRRRRSRHPRHEPRPPHPPLERFVPCQV